MSEIIDVSDFTEETTELIIIEQLPIIKQRLELLSEQIDEKIKYALSLEVSETTVKEVKKIRAELNKEKNGFEERRIQVKKAIMDPYSDFESTYKAYVLDKYQYADNELSKQISEIETAEKAKKKNEVEAYANEYLVSKNIDFVDFEDIGLNITLSAGIKSLKEQAKNFIDRVEIDLELIGKQESKEEILVEYKNNLDASTSIITVVNRHQEIERQKALLAEQEEKKRLMAEVAEKVVAAVEKAEPIAPPAVEAQTEEAPVDPIITVKFTVTAERSKLKALKRFMIDGGIKYE